MILLDGKKLSEKILVGVKQEVSGLNKKIRLAIVVVGEDPVVRQFIERKQKAAHDVGIEVRVYPFSDSVSTNELRARLAEIVHEEKNTGVIVQLPLPEKINSQYILNGIVPSKDVDVLSARSLGLFVSGKSRIMPPVVGAVKTLLEEYKIDYRTKKVVVVGAGQLVGKPVVLWLLNEKATFAVIRSSTINPDEMLRSSDIIITGIGKPKFLTGDMIKEGVVVIDAGTSESAGKIVGDVDFDSVAARASYLTPVPGGIGPLTVAMLLKNLVSLVRRK